MDEATPCAPRQAPALSLPLGISPEILPGGWYRMCTLSPGLNHSEYSLTSGFWSLPGLSLCPCHP